MATPISKVQNQSVPQASNQGPVVSAVPAGAPVSQPAAPVQANVTTQRAPVTGQVTTQKKPKGKFGKLFLKPDWLFILACLIAVGQVLLLVSLENEKNEYNELKKEDADRVYILQKASSVTQEDLDTLEKAFLSEKDVISFIQTLETSRPMFDEFVLEFTSDVPQGKDIHYLPFTILAVGTRATILSFIDKLLGSTYAVEATTLSMKEETEDPTKVSVSFTGNLYIQNGK